MQTKKCLGERETPSLPYDSTAVRTPTDPSGRLLSLLSHELRSPLGVIRGYLRMLDSPGSALSNQQRNAVAGALKAADHLAHLLSQASYLAQLRRGDTPLDLVRVDVARVVEAAVQAVRAAPDLNVSCDVGEILGTHVVTNHDRMRDAFAFLIAAVAKAQMTPKVLAVTGHRTKLEQRDGVRLRIEAPGVASQATEGVFDTTRGGLGLDLPIAENVIASHGGRVSELTASGRCVGMIVWLPVAP